MGGREHFLESSVPIGRIYYSHFGWTVIAQEKFHERSAPVKGKAETHDLSVVGGSGNFLERSASIYKVLKSDFLVIIKLCPACLLLLILRESKGEFLRGGISAQARILAVIWEVFPLGIFFKTPEPNFGLAVNEQN